MKSIYLSPDEETMVLYDDQAPSFTILLRRGKQAAEEKHEDEAPREKKKGKSGYHTHSKQFMNRNHGKRVRHCSNCGKTGHRVTTCPEGNNRASAGGDEAKTDKSTMTLSELREKVQALKEQGMNSVEVAKELGISLALVNKCW